LPAAALFIGLWRAEGLPARPGLWYTGGSKQERRRDMADKAKKSGQLESIPGVGKRIAGHLRNIGIQRVEDLRGQDPEELYRRDCLFKGFQEDRCILYVFRLAVYYAEHDAPEAEKLKWWYWKDKEYQPGEGNGQ